MDEKVTHDVHAERAVIHAEIEDALREQLALLRRASEQVAAQDDFYDEKCRALCNLSDALVKVSACLRGTA